MAITDFYFEEDFDDGQESLTTLSITSESPSPSPEPTPHPDWKLKCWFLESIDTLEHNIGLCHEELDGKGDKAAKKIGNDNKLDSKFHSRYLEKLCKDVSQIEQNAKLIKRAFSFSNINDMKVQKELMDLQRNYARQKEAVTRQSYFNMVIFGLLILFLGMLIVFLFS